MLHPTIHQNNQTTSIISPNSCILCACFPPPSTSSHDIPNGQSHSGDKRTTPCTKSPQQAARKGIMAGGAHSASCVGSLQHEAYACVKSGRPKTIQNAISFKNPQRYKSWPPVLFFLCLGRISPNTICNEILDRDAPNIQKYNSSRSGPGAPVRHLLQLEIRISWDFDGV